MTIAWSGETLEDVEHQSNPYAFPYLKSCTEMTGLH